MEPTAETDEPGPVQAAATMVRLIAGWAGTSLGVLNLAMGVDSGDWPYLAFHLALLATGLGLLAFGTLRKQPDRTAYLTFAAVTIAGLVLSATPPTGPGCCLSEYPNRHGIPFTLLAGGPGGRHFAPGHAVVDLIFWACIGFLALVLVTMFRPAPATPPAEHTPRHATHAEERTPAPHDESVGGLP